MYLHHKFIILNIYYQNNLIIFKEDQEVEKVSPWLLKRFVGYAINLDRPHTRLRILMEQLRLALLNNYSHKEVG